MNLLTRLGRVVIQGVTTRFIDFLALLLLSFVGVTGSFVVNRAIPVPEHMLLILFGIGVISSVILIKFDGYEDDLIRDSPENRIIVDEKQNRVQK